MNYCRLTDNDRHVGPFDLGERHMDWRPLSLVLQSGCDEYPGCAVIARAFGWTLRIRLPRIMKPFEIRHKAETWDAATIERVGRDWWAEVHPREFGFSVNEGFLQVFFGPQTHDSATTKSWSKFLPWTQWRHVRISYFDPAGGHLRTYFDTTSREVRRAQSEDRYEFVKTMPKATFMFRDYDGEEIEAATHIEEREWRFGEGWFKWLSLFRRPKIRRSLDITFSKEVGPRKGSWKGGTVGHGIDMMPDETPVQAFARYCAEHNLTLVA